MSETPHPHAVFWIDLAKISPNPYQPRKYFDEQKLQDLSDSIRRYGVLQPIVVTRSEERTPDGGMTARYEIIAGERRFRASQMAGLEKIPAIIREGEQTDKEKLELAILENLQREDLNPVDKARSFNRLVDEFELTHAEVAERLGKSREYVSNSLRLLQLPDHILDALSMGQISEGHTRPLLMLKERPDEQQTLFTQMTQGAGITVRDAETFARSIATEKQRKNKDLDPEMKEIQQQLSSHLGTKVSIDKKTQGGKVTIEFGNRDDLRQLLEKISQEESTSVSTAMQQAPSIPAAHSTNPVRNTEQSTQDETVHHDAAVSDLQKEIDALASMSSANSTEQVAHEDVVFNAPQETPQSDLEQSRSDKFAFNNSLSSNDPDAYNTDTTVNVVSDNSFDTFADPGHPDPVSTADEVALGDDFVPGRPSFQEPRQFGTMTSDAVNDTEKKDGEFDDDLYNLKNFSV